MIIMMMTIMVILNYNDNDDDDNNYNTNGTSFQFAEHLSRGKFPNLTQVSFVVSQLILNTHVEN